MPAVGTSGNGLTAGRALSTSHEAITRYIKGVTFSQGLQLAINLSVGLFGSEIGVGKMCAPTYIFQPVD